MIFEKARHDFLGKPIPFWVEILHEYMHPFPVLL